MIFEDRDYRQERADAKALPEVAAPFVRETEKRPTCLENSGKSVKR